MADAAARMLGHLPALTAGADLVVALLGAEGTELDRQEDLLAAALREANPVTATAAGLGVLEATYGLGAVPDDLEARRARVLAFLRSRGTTTIDRVVAVASSFENGQVAVIEDHHRRLILLRFTSVYGVPPNVEAMLAAVRRLMPENARVLVEYRFPIWDQIDARGLTWDQAEAYGLTWDQAEAFDWVNAP